MQYLYGHGSAQHISRHRAHVTTLPIVSYATPPKTSLDHEHSVVKTADLASTSSKQDTHQANAGTPIKRFP